MSKSSTSDRVPCLDCKHYVPTGTEDSGLASASGDGTNWHYSIGRCALPVVTGCRSDDHIPSWYSCYRSKKKRGKKTPA